MDGIEITSPENVRALIAHEWLAGGVQRKQLGAVTLRPHQIDAARRLTTMIATHGGALLADDVGLGKTYVALAVARQRARPLVVAPAALRSMWQSAAAACEIGVEFVSMESLSRSAPKTFASDLLIVDEAHHFRTSSTLRYRALATLAARCPILLVSATPLHNRASDIASLLSLFLGSAARTVRAGDLMAFMVRRDQRSLPDALPIVAAPARIQIRARVHALRNILELPPPTPAIDGGVAHAMVTHTLVRLWASSDAALQEALRRRWAKAVAMRHSMEAGRYPTRRELLAWTYSDGAVQLGFPELLTPGPHEGCSDLLAAIVAHEQALTALIGKMKSERGSDHMRVAAMRTIQDRHRSTGIVAFSQFAETIRMYYRGLAPAGGVAMLTSRGARIASGPITRREALEGFAPVAQSVSPPDDSRQIWLLLTTDLLSEGVNLQDAAVVVHLDLPWTAAALEQRVGRVARLGSMHRNVFVYAIDPPAPTSRLVRAEELIRRKAALAERSVGASRIPPLFARVDGAARSGVEELEAVRRMVAGWLSDARPRSYTNPVCAAIGADRDGVLALVSVRGKQTLVAAEASTLSVDVGVLRTIAERANGTSVPSNYEAVTRAIEAAERWIEAELAKDDAGGSRSAGSRLARKVTARLARDFSACPRHRRSQCSVRITALLQRLESPFTLGVEWEIEQLLESSTRDLLTGLEKIVGPRAERSVETMTGIRAVLVLRAKARSQKPEARS